MDAGPILGIINNLINAATAIGVTLMIFWLIISAIKLGASSGNPSEEAAAKRAIVHALVGTVIIVAARIIIAWIQTAVR